MRLKRVLAAFFVIGLLIFPQLAKAEGNYIQVGFSDNAQLDPYNAQAGFSYYAVGSVDGAAVQDRDGNTWPGYGVGAIAFEPTDNVNATAIENIVQAISLNYGATPTIRITFAPGVDLEDAMSRIGVVTSGLTTDFNVTPGNLPAGSYQIDGQILTIDTMAGILSATTPVVVKLTFENFSTPGGLPVGNFFVYGKAYGLSDDSATSSPKLVRLDVLPASATFTNNSVLKATFDEAVRINQTPSVADSLLKINAVLVKAFSSTDEDKMAVLDGVLDAIATDDHMVTMTEVVDAIADAGSVHEIAVDLNGNSAFLVVQDGGDFEPVTPPPPPPPITDGATVTEDCVNNGSVSDITLADGVTVINNGTITNVTMGADSIIKGGTVRGTIIGEPGATILNAIVDAVSITGVRLGRGCRVTQDTVENVPPGLDLTGAVMNPGGQIPSNAPILVDLETGEETTLKDLLRQAVNSLLSDTTCDTREDADGAMILNARNLHGINVPGKITRVMTTDEDDGAQMTPEGDLVIIQNGIAMTLAPVSHNLASFEEALMRNGASHRADDHGVVIVTLPGGLKLSLRFNSFSEMGSNQAVIAQGEASLRMAGSPDERENYHLMVTYPDGATQSMLPFIHDLDALTRLCDDNGIRYRFNPSTGAFQLMDGAGNVFYRGIPDFFLNDPPAGTTGISFELEDVNGDGLNDVLMTTPNGKQLIYSLPL